MWPNILLPKFFDQNFGHKIFITKIMWPKLLWPNFCDLCCVTKILWPNLCDQNLLTKILWPKFGTKVLWPTSFDQNFVNKGLWLKLCDQHFGTQIWWPKLSDKKFVTKIFKASALWADDFYKSKCPSVCPSVCLSVCLFTFEVPFNGHFAPTSRSQMSIIFRGSESLGKSIGKKWSNIWIFLFGSGLKSPRKKKFFFCCWFCLTKHGGNHASRSIRDLWSKGVSLILAYL